MSKSTFAMSSYTYTRLTTTDTERLRALRHVFAVAFDGAEAYQDEPSNEYLVRFLANPMNIALVAEAKDSTVVGGLIAYVLQKVEKEHCEIYLYDLAVAEDYRRQGIATSLIEHLKAIGKDLGAWVIFVQADNVDTEAVALYTKLCSSVESDITHFDIRVDK